MAIGSGVHKSHQPLNQVYFRTLVIKDWKHLLKEDEMDDGVFNKRHYAENR